MCPVTSGRVDNCVRVGQRPYTCLTISGSGVRRAASARHYRGLHILFPWWKRSRSVVSSHFRLILSREIMVPGPSSFFLNPLWGHCQEYKIEKNAILQERLLSEKGSTFVHYNLTLSESICFADHEKQIQKFVAHRKVCQKSSQREVTRKNAYKAPKPQGV